MAEVTKLGEMLSKFSLNDAKQPPSKDDAKNMMHGFMEESSMEQFMPSAFILHLALHPSEWVAVTWSPRPTSETQVYWLTSCPWLRGEDTSFKASQKLSGYRDIILACHNRAHGSQTPLHSGPAIRNLLSQLSSSDDEDEPPRKVAKKPLKKQTQPLSSDDDSD